MGLIRPGFPGSAGSFKDLFLLAAAPDPTGAGRGGPGGGGGVGGGAGGMGEGTLMDDSGGLPGGPVNSPGVGGATSTVQRLSTLFPQCVCIYAPQVRAVGGVSFPRVLTLNSTEHKQGVWLSAQHHHTPPTIVLRPCAGSVCGHSHDGRLHGKAVSQKTQPFEARGFEPFMFLSSRLSIQRVSLYGLCHSSCASKAR